MLPSSFSCSGIDSFSFSVPRSQPADISNNQEPDSTSQTPPSSDLLLRSGTTKASPGAAPAPASGINHISTLPTMLLWLIKSWLINTEALQLIYTSHCMSDNTQAFYRLRLRKTVAQHAASPIASCRNSVNLLPAWVPMNQEGEQAFQNCLVLKTSGLSEADYCSAALQILKTALSQPTDLFQLRHITTGVALGLGGTLMLPAQRAALAACILSSYGTSSAEQMGLMILGVCAGFGNKNNRAVVAHIFALFDQILTSYPTSRPEQMRSMICSLCTILGGKKIEAENRNLVVTKILTSYLTSNAAQILNMIQGTVIALGEHHITPDQRDGLVQQILTLYGTNRLMPQRAIVQGLCRGLGGRNILKPSLERLLAQFLGTHESWDHIEMGLAVACLCMELGGQEIAPDHRDTVLTRVMASGETSSRDQLCSMIWAIGRSLGGGDISPDNLSAIMIQILRSHGILSQLTMGTLIYYLFRCVGDTHCAPANREVLTACIRDSGHVHDIVQAIKSSIDGQQVVDFLQLETAPD